MPPTQSRPPAAHVRKPFLNSLSLRLFVLLFGVIAIAFAVYTLASVNSASRYNRQIVNQGAERLSGLIQRSTHYGMLLNRKDDVHQIIQSIAEQSGVEAVRIYDKEGVIIYAAETDDIGRRVDLQAEACVTCHEADAPLRSVPVDSRSRVFEGPDGTRVLGRINPIENAPECSDAACHAHPAEQTILGVLDVTMSMADADRIVGSAQNQAVLGAVLMALLAGSLSATFIFLMVRRPVGHLIEGADRISKGDLDTSIRIERRDEIGQLATAFNNMTRDLRVARQELTDWSARLETRLKEKTDELSHSHRQIAHMDKMASLGKLAATVAHELNNPLAGILNYAKLVSRTLGEGDMEDPEIKETLRQLSLIQREAGRSGAIVRNLLAFARPSGAELALHSFNGILDRSVQLLRHHLEMSEISLVVEPIEDDDQLVCDADQLQQAIVALLVNAVEAMSEGGVLTVQAEASEYSVNLRISATGIGIHEADQSRIFEPFFSSKDDADGAGLGLAVVYGIIQRHLGDIRVESTSGKGTTFIIDLPRRSPQNDETHTG
jgi:two-component system NtrC family sensor kinase